MSERPSEHLARIKRQHPLWSIRPVSQGIGWTAHRGNRRIYAVSSADLETQLRSADRNERCQRPRSAQSVARGVPLPTTSRSWRGAYASADVPRVRPLVHARESGPPGSDPPGGFRCV